MFVRRTGRSNDATIECLKEKQNILVLLGRIERKFEASEKVTKNTSNHICIYAIFILLKLATIFNPAFFLPFSQTFYS